MDDKQHDQQFTWHPRYKGKSITQVTAELRADLEPDQRSYTLALEGAEDHENQVLASILDLDKKWSIYDMDWVTADPSDLAQRIALFEFERDQQQELFSFDQYRRRNDPPVTTPKASTPRWAFWKR